MRLFQITSAAALTFVVFAGTVYGGEPETVGDVQFEKLHALIKRQPGESRWMEIDWHANVWEARKQAAAEGKPLFLMAGSGGAPAAGC